MSEIPFSRLNIPKDLRDRLTPDSPRDGRLLVARDEADLPAHVTVSASYILLNDPEPEIASAARSTLLSMPADVLIKSVLGQATHPKILEFLATHRYREQDLSYVIYRIRSANTRTATLIAEHAESDLIEEIVRNQERLLITPQVFRSLERNPNCEPEDLERVASFLRMMRCLPKEDAGGAQPAPPAIDTEETRKRLLAAEVEAALLGLPSPKTNHDVAEKVGLEMFQLEDAAGAGTEKDYEEFVFNYEEDAHFTFNLTADLRQGADEEEKASTVTQQLAKMAPGQKIKLAYLGNSEVRRLLVKDRNKVVAVAVVKSGRLTDSEVLAIAKNRNLEGEVIRELVRDKDAMRKYQVKVALANNPKTPVSAAVALVNQLNRRDLEALARNKNIPGAVNQLASRKVRAARQGQAEGS